MTKESKRIYNKTTRTWYEVPEDQYREYDRWRTALRKRMQYRGECFCPRSKWWLCDGNCLDCEFHNSTTVSLDDPLPDGEGTLADYVPDDAPLIEEVLAEKAELDQLFARLQELMPEAKRIGELREEGLSDEAIADIIGIKRTTFLSRLKKAKEKLAKEFPYWF
jgi:DNA-directed RNA polymerase specialized sigma24 family protein